MKALYPKAKLVKMQKRKVGPTHKAIQFAFVTFENESDCSEAFKAHTQIGGEKVNVSYAFAQANKKQQEKKPATNTTNDSNKNKKKLRINQHHLKKIQRKKKKHHKLKNNFQLIQYMSANYRNML